MERDTAERRKALHIWQELGRGAAREFWNQRGHIYMRVPKNRRKKSRVAYIEGWNREMRFIAATQTTEHRSAVEIFGEG